MLAFNFPKLNKLISHQTDSETLTILIGTLSRPYNFKNVHSETNNITTTSDEDFEEEKMFHIMKRN